MVISQHSNGDDKAYDKLMFTSNGDVRHYRGGALYWQANVPDSLLVKLCRLEKNGTLGLYTKDGEQKGYIGSASGELATEQICYIQFDDTTDDFTVRTNSTSASNLICLGEESAVFYPIE